jgi:Protein of unknown function (DUF2752).
LGIDKVEMTAMMKKFFRMNKIHTAFPRNIQKQSLRLVRERIHLCICIFIIYLFLSLLHIGCPIKFVTGISCPGCGMTRAVLSALRLNFKEAFHYHPLFFMTPVMLFLFLFEEAIKPIYYKIAWFIIILLFFLIYIFRLFISSGSIVSIDINDGIMLKLIHQISLGGMK